MPHPLCKPSVTDFTSDPVAPLSAGCASARQHAPRKRTRRVCFSTPSRGMPIDPYPKRRTPKGNLLPLGTLRLGTNECLRAESASPQTARKRLPSPWPTAWTAGVAKPAGAGTPVKGIGPILESPRPARARPAGTIEAPHRTWLGDRTLLALRLLDGCFDQVRIGVELPVQEPALKNLFQLRGLQKAFALASRSANHSVKPGFTPTLNRQTTHDTS
jgi:hypothetical protein